MRRERMARGGYGDPWKKTADGENLQNTPLSPHLRHDRLSIAGMQGEFMNAARTQSNADLAVTLALARLLERLERSAVPVDPLQYRSVVLHLVDRFKEGVSEPALQILLDQHPAAAELYENMNYQYAGLCRSPLEASLAAEISARHIIDRVKRGTT
jgi:hypothetical protein